MVHDDGSVILSNVHQFKGVKLKMTAKVPKVKLCEVGGVHIIIVVAWQVKGSWVLSYWIIGREEIPSFPS